MTATEFHKLQRANPFAPYRIRLADGKTIHVPHPDFVAISPTGRMATAYSAEGEMHIIDIFLVTDLAIEPLAAARRIRKAKG